MEQVFVRSKSTTSQLNINEVPALDVSHLPEYVQMAVKEGKVAVWGDVLYGHSREQLATANGLDCWDE